MIRLDSDVVVNDELVKYCVDQYANELTRIRKLKKDYLGEAIIKNRQIKDITQQNNKLVHSFAKYISNVATAYFMGIGLKYSIKNTKYNKLIQEIIINNHYDTQNLEEAKEMSIAGVSYELMYINSDGKFKTLALEADEVIPVYGTNFDEYLVMALRLYEKNNIKSITQCVEVYTKDEIITFEKKEEKYIEVDRKNHIIGDVPIIVRRNNLNTKGDFEDVQSIIDAYDRTQSNTMNDMDAFTEAYLVASGVEDIEIEEDKDGKTSSNKGFRDNKVFYLPEGAELDFLVKNINDTANENFKNRLYKDIFTLSQVPNITDESFGGNISGVAMKYKMFGLEQLTSEKEKCWKSAERKKLKIITNYINTINNTKYNYRDVEISFDRSQIANLLETSEIMLNLKGILSDETIIGMYPEIQNVKDEIAKIKQENAENENNYGIG